MLGSLVLRLDLPWDMVVDDKINKEYTLDIVKWSVNTSKRARVVETR